MRLWSLSLILTGSSVMAACVSDPVFEQANGAVSTSSDPTLSANDDMVLVPATTLASLTTQSEKSKGKGKDDENKAPTPKPAPAPSSTPAPAPTPPTTGTIVVAAFWIDRAPVAVGDYDACVSAGLCRRASCSSLGGSITCITHAQANAYCTWKQKRLVRDVEWTAASKASVSGLTGLSGGAAEWVESQAGGDTGIARGGATSSASMPLGLDSSIPTVGFRCARDR